MPAKRNQKLQKPSLVSHVQEAAPSRSWTRSPRYWLIAAIFLLAAYLRFHDLAATPGLCFDEAVNGVNAMEALASGQFQVFYPDNNGREGLFINLQALSLGAFGAWAGDAGSLPVEPWMLRFPSAVFGLLTVAGVFFLGRALTRSDFVGGAAAFFLGTSFWHINFSRIGLRAIMSPFWLVWALFFLVWGFAETIKSPGRRGYTILALAGICYGAGFHSYIAYRVTPVLMLLTLAWEFGLFRHAGKLRLWAVGTALFAGISALVASPLLFYAIGHPQSVSTRTEQLAVWNSPTVAHDLLQNTWKALLMFNVSGDQLARHNVPGRPELFLPVGLLFLLGVVLGIRRIVRRSPESWPFLLSIVWVALAAVPAIVANESHPHALRSILMIPACMLLAAEGADWLRGWLSTRISQRMLIAVGCAAALLLTAEADCTYFGIFVHDPRTRTAFEADLADLGREIAGVSDSIPKYIIMIGVKLDDRGAPKDFYTLALLAGGYDAAARESHNVHFVTAPEEADRVVRQPGVQAWVVR